MRWTREEYEKIFFLLYEIFVYLHIAILWRDCAMELIDNIIRIKYNII
jgi:hypothetical protein